VVVLLPCAYKVPPLIAPNRTPLDGIPVLELAQVLPLSGELNKPFAVTSLANTPPKAEKTSLLELFPVVAHWEKPANELKRKADSKKFIFIMFNFKLMYS
jgi:hypothetical protein